MKNASEYAKKFATLVKKLKQTHHPEPPPKRDPVTQLVLSFLLWDSTRKAAEAAHTRLMAAMVDNNDLRVSHTHEIIGLIGPRYPRAEERAARLRDCLNEVFNREHATALESLAAKSKKDVRAYLETLPGMMPYVMTQMLLLSFEGAAIPVDETLAALLKKEDVVDPDATLDEIARFLEHNVKAEEALATHLTFQAWADASPRPALPEVRRAAVPPPVTAALIEPAPRKAPEPVAEKKMPPAAKAPEKKPAAKPAVAPAAGKMVKKPAPKPAKK